MGCEDKCLKREQHSIQRIYCVVALLLGRESGIGRAGFAVTNTGFYGRLLYSHG